MDFHLVAWLIVQDNQGRILLGRRANVSYGAGLWGLPGGHVEDSETLLAAALREAHEEVGLTAQSAEPLGVTRYAEPGQTGADFFFVAREWTGEPVPLAETSEVGWFALDALPPDCLPWLPQALNHHLQQGRWFAETVNPAP